MLTLLLHKASNVPVMCLVTLIDSLIGSSLRTSDLPLLPLLYYWLGQAFYFYQVTRMARRLVPVFGICVVMQISALIGEF